MLNLNHSSILFFAPAFFGYERDICNRLLETAAHVDFFDERPRNSFLFKSLLRMTPRIVKPIIRRYYAAIYKQTLGQHYDYILILNLEAMPIEFLKRMRQVHPESTFVLHMWDSINNKKRIPLYQDCFDKMYSFDKIDCANYPFFRFLPSFYKDQYRPLAQSQEFDYDFLFVGTAHSDRYQLIQTLKTQIVNQGYSFFGYFFLQDRRLFFYNKLCNRAYKQARLSDFSFTPLSAEKFRNLLKRSRVMIDIQHPRQNGLTMRALETLIAGRKLITTNASIKEYDFYSERNVCIVDRQNPKIDFTFINEPFEPLAEDVFQRYSLDAWLQTLLSPKD